jgi:hypothetical protein
MRSTPYPHRRLGGRRSGAIVRPGSSSSIANHQPCIVDSILNLPVVFSFSQPTLSIRRRGCTAPFAGRLRPLSCMRPLTRIELGCIRSPNLQVYLEVQPWTTQ